MIRHSLETGTVGELVIQDRTDDPNDMTVLIGISTSEQVIDTQAPWAYSLDGVMSNWSSFHVGLKLYVPGAEPDSHWHPISAIFVGDTVNIFTFHLGETGNEQLGGPTDLSINVYGYASTDPDAHTVRVKHEGLYKQAIPYVKHDGLWRLAEPFVKDGTLWKHSS